jgi:hypothetical protein
LNRSARTREKSRTGSVASEDRGARPERSRSGREHGDGLARPREVRKKQRSEQASSQ